MTFIKSILFVGLTAAGLTFATVGCANVKPWQRGHLADYIMCPDRDPLGNTFSEHIYFTRETANGGRGVGGGGCGCN